ncbi:MAG TPA: GGDEF domain-containing protein [Gammaproteobacteria bacterium]|nr:GGDEF domain-containing protein [Gammaproteobacteria bacterium]
MLPQLKDFSRDLDADVDQAELRGLARNSADGALLLLVLSGLYLLTPGSELLRPILVVVAFALFTLFSLVLRFVPGFRRETRLKISLELVAMIAFTSAFLYSVETRASLLLILYLLPVIISALTLGRWATLVVTVLSVAGFLLAAVLRDPASIPAGREVVELGIALAPFLLVAYITALLAHEITTAKQHIRVLSETDELTGLANLRAFSRLQRQEHERAVRHERMYSVLAMDLNGLKQINDAFGHHIGDRAIILFANVIARLTRTTDAAARLGGDEFVALLSETDAEQAARVMHRIRSATERSTFDVGGRIVRLSVSIGAATFDGGTETPHELIAAADQAMYRDKQARRNAPATSDFPRAEVV